MLSRGMGRLTQDWRSLFLETTWAIALVGLPLTSFPLLVRTTGAIVAPFSALPGLVLILTWLLPYLALRGALPREIRLFIVFSLVALAVSAAAMFIEIPTFKAARPYLQELRALFTLAVGFAFLVLFSTWPRDARSFQRTLLWINLGGMALVGWSACQVYYIFFKDSIYPGWMLSIQEWLAFKPEYFFFRANRVSGLAYEASWFSHQMVVLYLPLWVACTLTRYSSFHWRILRLSFENILMVLGAMVFFLSSPRIGLLSFFLIAIFIILKLNFALYHKIVSGIFRHWRPSPGKAGKAQRLIAGLGTSLVILGVYLAFVTLTLRVGSQRDWRLSLISANPPSVAELIGVLTLEEDTWLRMGLRFAFLERTSYWMTGLRIFNQHPWLGVGLGNAGFFFLEKMPAVGWSSYEIRDILYRLPALPNVKSFWVRLLAETGLVGFSIFITWVYLLWRSTRISARSNLSWVKTIALYGQCSLLAFLSEGFSIDSFAMPYFWVSAGLVAASAMYIRRNEKPPGNQVE